MTTTSMPAPAPISRQNISPPDSHSTTSISTRSGSPGPAAHASTPGRPRGSESSSNSFSTPPIIVKPEPRSPTESNSLPVPPSRTDNPRRRRPQDLDLQHPTRVQSNAASLSMDPALSHLAIACLSPGFRTTDPALQSTISRSLEVIDKQRRIIEARQNGKPDPPQGRRKPPPARLSLKDPSHGLMAFDERAIQSAPLNSSFTGLNRVGNHPPMIQPESGYPLPPNNTQHLQPTSNRLPPISNLLPNSITGVPNRHATVANNNNTTGYASPRLVQRGPVVPQHVPAPPPPSHNNPLPSPSFRPPSPPHPVASHPRFLHAPPRDYPTAEDNSYHGPPEAPSRSSFYGHTRPPSPPSSAIHRSTFPPLYDAPINGHPNRFRQSYGGQEPPQAADFQRNGSARRRPRDEYERDMGSPPLRATESRRPNTFTGTTDEQDNKKREFLSLCSQAWDLIHS